MSLGARKLSVLALVASVFVLANVWLVVKWLEEKGVIDFAKHVRREFLTGTAITIIVVCPWASFLVLPILSWVEQGHEIWDRLRTRPRSVDSPSVLHPHWPLCPVGDLTESSSERSTRGVLREPGIPEKAGCRESFVGTCRQGTSGCLRGPHGAVMIAAGTPDGPATLIDRRPLTECSGNTPCRLDPAVGSA
jgi:hypothetical protein